MKELITLTLKDETFDSFPDRQAREGLAKKLPMPSGAAKAGQYLRVLKVDAEGKITDVEAADAPTGAGSSSDSDWNAAEGEPGHIRNRTHYSEFGTVEILPMCDLAFSEDAGGFPVFDEVSVEVGKEYVVSWNGAEYTCTAVTTDLSGMPIAYLGNKAVMEEADTGEPFGIAILPKEAFEMLGFYGLVIPIDGTTELRLSITERKETVHKIPEKYLNQPDFGAASYEAGHIKNRTHYYQPEIVLLEEAEVDFADGMAPLNDRLEFAVGGEYESAFSYGDLAVYTTGTAELYVEEGTAMGVVCVFNDPNLNYLSITAVSFYPEYAEQFGVQSLLSLSSNSSGRARITIKRPEKVQQLDPMFIPPTPIPFFDLVELGLPIVSTGGSPEQAWISEEAYKELHQALENGVVHVGIAFSNGGKIPLYNRIPIHAIKPGTLENGEIVYIDCYEAIVPCFINRVPFKVYLRFDLRNIYVWVDLLNSGGGTSGGFTVDEDGYILM